MRKNFFCCIVATLSVATIFAQSNTKVNNDTTYEQSGGIEYLKNTQNKYLLQNGNDRSAFFEVGCNRGTECRAVQANFDFAQPDNFVKSSRKFDFA